MTTTEQLLYIAKDIDLDFNIKIIIMFIMFIYLIAMMYFSKLKDTDRYYEVIVKVLFM